MSKIYNKDENKATSGRTDLRLTASFRKLAAGENGSFMNTVVFLAVIVAIIGVFVIDGSSVFYTNQAAGEAAQEAANQATMEYRYRHNDFSAEAVAADYCSQKEMNFISFEINREAGHTYTVKCGRDATTYVFKYIPFFKELIPQESSKTSNI